MKTVVALGTLREDIYFNYDFSQPMNVPEIKVKKAEWSVGGSVHNTCYYLAIKNEGINVCMCSANYSSLKHRVNQESSASNYRIITTETELKEYPISIIGVRENGEKQLLSYDPEIDTDLLQLFEYETNYADFVYTSFYEINDNNFLEISRIMQKSLSRGVRTMIDLCPVISSFSENTIREMLNNITILSGNEHEYKDLMHKLGVVDMNKLLMNYPHIEYLFIKRGSNGAEYITRQEAESYKFRYEFDSTNVVVNTTGCGDIFNSVIIEGFCIGEKSQSILNRAVKQSGEIAKGGLPWVKK